MANVRLVWSGAILLLVALAATQARAQQDLDAGKSGAQLFEQDCAACHRTTRGLAKNLSGNSLVSYLREHYTSSSGSAALVAAYIQGAANSRADRPKGKEEQARPNAPQQDRSKLARPADSAAPQPPPAAGHAPPRPPESVGRPGEPSVEQTARPPRRGRRGAPVEPPALPSAQAAPGQAAPGPGPAEPPGAQQVAPSGAEAHPAAAQPPGHEPAASRPGAASAAQPNFSSPLP